MPVHEKPNQRVSAGVAYKAWVRRVQPDLLEVIERYDESTKSAKRIKFRNVSAL